MPKELRGDDIYDGTIWATLDQLSTLEETGWSDLDELVSHATYMTDQEVVTETEVSIAKLEKDIWVGPKKQNITKVCRLIVINFQENSNLLEEERVILEHFLALSILA